MGLANNNTYCTVFYLTRLGFVIRMVVLPWFQTSLDSMNVDDRL